MCDMITLIFLDESLLFVWYHWLTRCRLQVMRNCCATALINIRVVCYRDPSFHKIRIKLSFHALSARRNWKPQEKFTTSSERCWSIPRTNKAAVDKRHDWDLVGVAIGREFSLWGISDTTTLSPSHIYQVTHCKQFEDWLIKDDFYRYPNYECVSVTWLNDRVLVS